MSFASFAAVGTAVEGAYFRKEQENALRRQLEKMVGNGQLPRTALQPQNQKQLAETVSNTFPALSDVPVTILKGSPNGDYVYQHVKGKVPGWCTGCNFAALAYTNTHLTLICSTQAEDTLVHSRNSCQLWQSKVCHPPLLTELFCEPSKDTLWMYASCFCVNNRITRLYHW